VSRLRRPRRCRLAGVATQDSGTDLILPVDALGQETSYEPSTSPWPKADGLVSLLEPGGSHEWQIALEYKRQQEGVHGLTLLRNYGFVSPQRHRLAVGIPINWERVLETLDIDL